MGEIIRELPEIARRNSDKKFETLNFSTLDPKSLLNFADSQAKELRTAGINRKVGTEKTEFKR